MAFGSIDTAIDALIIFSGVVTSVPLICYAEAVRRLKLITIGFLQYISPSLAFSLAVLKYDEEFTSVHQISFGLIWSGLVIFLADVLWNRRAKL
jgi:chloramphenicol-sensitive protein RarD